METKYCVLLYLRKPQAVCSTDACKIIIPYVIYMSSLILYELLSKISFHCEAADAFPSVMAKNGMTTMYDRKRRLRCIE